MGKDIYIVSACRTPIGNFMGQFSKIRAAELGQVVIKESLNRAGLMPNDVDQLIMGQTLTAGQGQNPARQASLKAGIPLNAPAFTINMLCGSGLKAVYLAWQALSVGDADIVIAGGQESMSQAHHSAYVRGGARYGQVQMVDTLQIDGLTDAFNNVSMGLTAEHLVDKYSVSRTDQDQYAVESQSRTQRAMENDYFLPEIVPIFNKKSNMNIIKDEFPNFNTTLEKLSKLKPAFRENGTVTSGNASGMNDGAAALVLVTEEVVKQKNLQPLVRIIGFAESGNEPMEMGLGPVPAVQKLLKKISWTKDDVDIYELNEAFAVQSILCVKMLDLDPSKVNVSGGALALGHPIGASGARILVTLIYNLQRHGKKRGVAALCVGGGMGIAIAVERCDG